MPSCSYGQNEEIDGTIECVAKSDKRKELMNLINKKKEKLPLSYMQEGLQQLGVKINVDSDDDEEEEIEPNKEENKEKKENEKKDNNEIEKSEKES